ncbi:ISL3 family transposase [Streptomyces sp.]|uniref:ISL3 family transposase n=1 Tax=Streptomyces sp. TaxID=1931 RepID=UPI0039C8C410
MAAQQDLRPRRVQALPGRTLGRGLHQHLEALGGDRSLGLSRQVRPGQRLPAREAHLATAGHREPPAPRVVTRWILTRPETLTQIEQLRLKAILANCPELDALTGHVRSFAQMLTERQGERLPQWLDAIRQDALPSLHTLAAGIDRDRDAVIAGLTLPWSSGVVEGHVNRIKMLKRQMFGRAGFALLRKRVLLAQ